ncbi:MAG: cohesin domain-containing protein, partial [bacterium]
VAAAGQTVNLPVVIDDAAGVLAYRLALELPNNSPDYPLEFVGVHVTETLTESWRDATVNDMSTSSGVVVIANAAGNRPTLPNGSGTLIFIRLKVKDNASEGIYGLAFKTEWTELNDGGISVTAVEGSIQVTAQDDEPVGVSNWHLH